MPPPGTWGSSPRKTGSSTYTAAEAWATTRVWVFWSARMRSPRTYVSISPPWWTCSSPAGTMRTEATQGSATCAIPSVTTDTLPDSTKRSERPCPAGTSPRCIPPPGPSPRRGTAPYPVPPGPVRRYRRGCSTSYTIRSEGTPHRRRSWRSTMRSRTYRMRRSVSVRTRRCTS